MEDKEAATSREGLFRQWEGARGRKEAPEMDLSSKMRDKNGMNPRKPGVTDGATTGRLLLVRSEAKGTGKDGDDCYVIMETINKKEENACL